MNRFTNRPAFLSHGFLHWRAHGYALAATPDIDLLSGEALRSSDPWVQLAATVEHAKQGDRTHLRDLEPLIRDRTIDDSLRAGALDLITDAGGRRDLELLADLMLDDSRELKLEAVKSAGWVGVLWLIPFMASVLENTPRFADRESIQASISRLINPPGGNVECWDIDEPPRHYVERVESRVAELTVAAGTDEVAVFRGELFDLANVVSRMRAELSVPSPNLNSGFFVLRHRFEAFTGIDCSSFYRKYEFEPKTARVVVKKYLKANPVLPFVPGHRYFFMRDLFGT